MFPKCSAALLAKENMKKIVSFFYKTNATNVKYYIILMRRSQVA
jgi:hypothetical protein